MKNLTLVLLMLLGPLAAPAAAASRQTAGAALTSTAPGTPTGSRLAIEWRDPAKPAGKPPAVRTIAIHLPPGTAIDTSVPARCTANDLELILLGASACPAASRIGGGSLITDTGSPSSS